jgi:hypothetical protein
MIRGGSRGGFEPPLAAKVTILKNCLLGERRAPRSTRPEALISSFMLYTMYRGAKRNIPCCALLARQVHATYASDSRIVICVYCTMCVMYMYIARISCNVARTCRARSAQQGMYPSVVNEIARFENTYSRWNNEFFSFSSGFMGRALIHVRLFAVKAVWYRCPTYQAA